MNVVGIVTEHNPYHNGHQYHVEKARKACGADCVVSVMSGHFLQRGEPALFNKWARAKMAVLGGVDLVIELPAAFSVRSASIFAKGAVALLNATGVVTHLCFGSESGDITELWTAARILARETPEFGALLHDHLGRGLSFPAARAQALAHILRDSGQARMSPGFYESPNNILGMEYLRALLELNSSIIPVTVKRQASGYHDRAIRSGSRIASATGIRDELLREGSLTASVRNVVPATTFAVMEEEMKAGRGPVFIRDYERILFYLLRTTDTRYLAGLPDATEGLENRIAQAARDCTTVRELIAHIKSKRYTWTRIQRILTCLLLGYTAEMAAAFDSSGPGYLRVLGLSTKGRTLLKRMKKAASVPVITRTAPYLSGHAGTGISAMLRLDVRATDVYTLLYPAGAARQGLDYRIMPFVAG